MDGPNRKDRRAQRAEGKLDTAGFLKLAGKFIELANRENSHVPATELHMAFLYAAARYNAHVAKAVLDVPDQEKFIAEITAHYANLLRQHLADPSLGGG
jgi:hypothetical protein